MKDCLARRDPPSRKNPGPPAKPPVRGCAVPQPPGGWNRRQSGSMPERRLRCAARRNSSLLQLSGDDVEGTQCGDCIGHIAAFYQVAECLKDVEARAATSQTVRSLGAVTDQIEPQLTVSGFPVRIHFTNRWKNSVLDELEMIHEVFDIRIHALLGWQADASI